LNCYVAMSPYKGNLVRLKRTGGQLFTVISDYTGKEIYILAKRIESSQNKLSNKSVTVDEIDLPGELRELVPCPAKVIV